MGGCGSLLREIVISYASTALHIRDAYRLFTGLTGLERTEKPPGKAALVISTLFLQYKSGFII